MHKKLYRLQAIENEARRIVINILDRRDKLDNSVREIWTDLIEATVFYTYLEKEKKQISF